MPRDKAAEDAGRRSHEAGGDWRDNPHAPGTRDWFAFEDGRRDAGATVVGPAPGTPGWA